MLDLQRKTRLEKLLLQLNIKEEIDLNLLDQALTHPSYIFEGRGVSKTHNQRLEFLGDAVVGLVIGQYLYENYPQKTEGELTKMRATVVCEASLFQGAKSMGIGEFLLMGRGEEQMGGAGRPSNLADSFEAFMGALYLCLGLEKVRHVILNVLKEIIEHAASGDFGDFKTKLQEYIQRDHNSNLSYKILQEEGPDHAKKFWAAVYLNEEELARGKGNTKKEAEQMAAKLALSNLGV